MREGKKQQEVKREKITAGTDPLAPVGEKKHGLPEKKTTLQRKRRTGLVGISSSRGRVTVEVLDSNGLGRLGRRGGEKRGRAKTQDNRFNVEGNRG